MADKIEMEMEMEKLWSTRSIVASDFPDDVQKAIVPNVVFGPDKWIMYRDEIRLQVMSAKGVWVLRLGAPRPMFFSVNRHIDADDVPIPVIKQGWTVNLEAPHFFVLGAVSSRFYMLQPTIDWVEPSWAKSVALHLMAMQVIHGWPRVEGGTGQGEAFQTFIAPALLIALSRARENAAREGMLPNDRPLITWVPEHEVG